MHALREREVSIAETGKQRLDNIEAALDEMKGTTPRLAGVEAKIDRVGSSLDAIFQLLQTQALAPKPAGSSMA